MPGPWLRRVDIFVGREPELAQLRAALEDACAGSVVFAMLVGEAGSGNYVTQLVM